MIIIGLFVCLLASAPLVNLHNVFYGDWNYRLWFIEYFGECFRHLTLPVVINTNQVVGIPVTLFYGQKFYALLGILSAFLGSAITIRVAVFMVFLLQFFQVYRAAMKLGSAKNVATGIAVIVTWAIYPLTNLYNRSDHAEFFAVAFLTCSLASLLCVIINPKKHPEKYDVIAMGLFYVAAAMTHPLTAEFGGTLLFILGVTALFFCEKERRPGLLKIFSATALLIFLVLSPWIYTLCQFQHKLPVASREAHESVFHGGGFYPHSIDNIMSRLSPFPLDLRATMQGVQNVPTPYLDAQIALPLIILIGVFIYIGWREKNTKNCLSACERAIVWSSAVMLMIVFIVSVYSKASSWFGGFFDIMDAPYRLTNYINLSALAVLIILAGRIGGANVNNKQVINVCLAFCIGISFSAVMEKLVHVRATSQKLTGVNTQGSSAYVENHYLPPPDKEPWVPLPHRSNSHLNEKPWGFYWYGSFSVIDGFAKDTRAGLVPVVYQNFNVLDGARLGQVQGLDVNLTRPSLVVTNVQPFPWNQIIVDSVPRPQSDIIVASFSPGSSYLEVPPAGREAVLLSQGSHRLQYVTKVDGVWKILNFLSWVILFGWMALYTVFLFKEDYL